MLLMVLNAIIIGVLSSLMIFYIVRGLDDADFSYGIVAFSLAFIGMWLGITKLLKSAHIKRISEGKDLGKCIGTYIAGKILLTVISLIFLFITLLVFGSGFESPEHRNVIYFLIIFLILENLNDIFISTFEARLEIAKIEIGKLIFNVVRMGAVVFVVINQLGIYGLAGTYLFSILFQTIFYLLMFKGYRIKRPSWPLMKSYIRFAIPLFIATIVGLAASVSINRVIIGFFWSPEDVGNYFAAWRMISSTNLIFVVGILLFPTFSKFHSEKLYSRISEYTYKAEKYIALFLLPAIVILILFPKDLVIIFLSDSFHPAVPMIRIMAISALFTALNVPYISQILGTDRPWIYAFVGIIQGILNGLFLVLLIPNSLFGINLPGMKGTGAAAATLISSVAIFILVRFIVRKYIVTRTKPNWRMIRFVLSGTILAVFFLILNLIFPLRVLPEAIDAVLSWISPVISEFGYLFAVPIYFLVGLAAHFLILYIIREITKNDLRYFLDVFNPKKMFVYIRDEIKG